MGCRDTRKPRYGRGIPRQIGAHDASDEPNGEHGGSLLTSYYQVTDADGATATVQHDPRADDAGVDAAVEAGCDAATNHTSAGDEIGTDHWGDAMSDDNDEIPENPDQEEDEKDVDSVPDDTPEVSS